MSVQCLLCDKRDAGHRYACHRCEQGLQRKLRHLETYATWFLTAEPYRGAGGRGAPGYGSRSPARDDVIAAMDIRSDGEVYGPDDSPTPIISIPGGLRYLATWVSQLDDTTESVPKDITGCVAYLLGRVPHMAMLKEIERFQQQVNILYTQARALAHDRPPGPLGRCLTVTCNGTVLERHNRNGLPDGGQCNGCSRVYNGPDLVRLSVAQEAS